MHEQTRTQLSLKTTCCFLTTYIKSYLSTKARFLTFLNQFNSKSCKKKNKKIAKAHFSIIHEQTRTQLSFKTTRRA